MSEICLSENFRLSTARPLLITGTDTDVGKTYVGGQLVSLLASRGIGVGVYKPVASGCHLEPSAEDLPPILRSSDAQTLWAAAGCPARLEDVCPQRFLRPLAPPIAARAEGKEVDRELMIERARWWQGRCEMLVIEGAGGLLSPLADDFSNAHLALTLGADLLVVAANRLGVINHTLLTLVAAEHFGLSVRGVILNQASPDRDESSSTNADVLRRSMSVPLVAVLEHAGRLVYSQGAIQ